MFSTLFSSLQRGEAMPTIRSLLLCCLLILAGCQTGILNPDGGSTTPGEHWSGRTGPVREFTTFQDFITSVYQTPDSLKQALVDSFLTWADDQTGIPYIEDSSAYFLYTNPSSLNVEVAGDFNGWTPNGAIFTHLSSTNLYYRLEEFESDARLDYKFVLNGANWILDPRNPQTVYGGYGPNSELRMPGYLQPPEIASFDIPHGSLDSFLFHDTTQGRSRTVQVYLPAGYNQGTDSLRSLYLHDGGEYLTLGSARNVLDYLIYHEQIPPLIAVFVDPTNRNEEYNYDMQFMEMFIHELVPHIDSLYRTFQTPDMRGVAGVSLGGLTSLLFTLHHPEVFGNCGAYSPAIWIGDLVQQYQAAEVLPVRIYMDAGTYEPSIWNPGHDLAEYLQLNGWDTIWYSWHEGHSWGSWRAHLDLGLEFFWPFTTSGIDESWD